MYQGWMKDTCAWTVHVQLCLCLRYEGEQAISLQSERKQATEGQSFGVLPMATS